MSYTTLACFSTVPTLVENRLEPIMLKSLPIIFFPEFPKKFSYYSFFILVCNLLFPNYAGLVSIASHLAFRIQ